MTRHVLFVPVHATSLLEMIPVANKVAADGKYQPLFFLHQGFTDEQVRMLQGAGLSAIGPGAKDRSKSSRRRASSERQPASPWRKRVRQILPLAVGQALSAVVDYVPMVIRAGKILECEAVVALVLVGDRHLDWETALVKAANRRHIPSLIIPFALSDPGGPAKLRLKDQYGDRYYGMQSLCNRIVGVLFPNWVHEHAGRRLLFSHGARAMVAWALGLMPQNPWVIGGGAATRMAVESPQLHRMFVKQGIPPEKLIITGKPSVDQTYETMHSADRHFFRKELNIPKAKRILLCSVPQLAEHGLMPWSQHWQEIEFLLDAFAKVKEVAVVLSLHPKSDLADYEPLADRYGATIARRRIYELLPICDVFVATYSSTVMQAIGIAKPTVVVDFYDLNYAFYDDAPGVIVLCARDQLASTLTRLFADRQYYGHLSETQQQQAHEWILLDGKCIERVIEELYRLIEG